MKIQMLLLHYISKFLKKNLIEFTKNGHKTKANILILPPDDNNQLHICFAEALHT